MNIKNLVISFILVWILAIMVPAVTAEGEPDTTSTGVTISIPALLDNISTKSVSTLDILPLLNVSSPADQGTPAYVSIITVNPGESISPNVTIPGYGVLYILSGHSEIMADEASVYASADDTILVPSGSVLKVKNSGTDQLRFFSLLSVDISSRENKTPELMKRSEGRVNPIMFGNESSRDQFNLTRILSPFEESLPLSFDIAIAHLPAGHIIGEHYLESGQLIYILSGKGRVIIGCDPKQIQTGDLTYIPPGAVQKIEADEELILLLLTEPFYVPEKDHSTKQVC